MHQSTSLGSVCESSVIKYCFTCWFVLSSFPFVKILAIKIRGEMNVLAECCTDKSVFNS